MTQLKPLLSCESSFSDSVKGFILKAKCKCEVLISWKAYSRQVPNPQPTRKGLKFTSKCSIIRPL